MTTEFTCNEEMKIKHSCKTEIKFIKGDLISFKEDDFWIVESVHYDFRKNIIYVWLDDHR